MSQLLHEQGAVSLSCASSAPRLFTGGVLFNSRATFVHPNSTRAHHTPLPRATPTVAMHASKFPRCCRPPDAVLRAC
jgi:hypothetical protein